MLEQHQQQQLGTQPAVYSSASRAVNLEGSQHGLRQLDKELEQVQIEHPIICFPHPV
jgi:hypothetical protein